MKDVLGVFHGTIAQVFFVLVSAIALFTSRWWGAVDREKENLPVYHSDRFRYVFAIVTALILLQLMLGAAMRHQHAGLAIPDFPMAYGKLWPDMDASAVARYNQARGEVTALNPITSFQVGLQMAHRIGAVLILMSVAWVTVVARRRSPAATALHRLSLLWFGLILAQASLGAATIWTNKAADIATAHVAVGALSLVTGAMLTLVACRGTTGAKATSSVQASGRVTEGRANPAYVNA
jgi:cytochrome c oxidase assembly protein subunit 15